LSADIYLAYIWEERAVADGNCSFPLQNDYHFYGLYILFSGSPLNGLDMGFVTLAIFDYAIY
ncbi:hypothetical protein, partial [Fortiea sp. LEGE XX443]|uniref:hypothetical protein n=1 Tax=Fortiea sp. LEGE XX443 TaxID=1828611 RepID=UPI001D14E00E